MAIAGRINDRTRTGIRKGEPRRKLSLESGSASFGGMGMNVEVSSLSKSGMLFETNAPLNLGERIKLLFPEAVSCEAVIVWENGTIFACQFETTLTADTISEVHLKNDDMQARSALANGAPPPETDSPETLGQRLRRLRREQRHSMVKFAKLVGVSKPTLWKWEKDASFPRKEMICALSRILGIAETEILYGRGHLPPGQLTDPASQLAAEEVITCSKESIARAMRIAPSRIKIVVEV